MPCAEVCWEQQGSLEYDFEKDGYDGMVFLGYRFGEGVILGEWCDMSGSGLTRIPCSYGEETETWRLGQTWGDLVCFWEGFFSTSANE